MLSLDKFSNYAEGPSTIPVLSDSTEQPQMPGRDPRRAWQCWKIRTEIGMLCTPIQGHDRIKEQLCTDSPG